MCVYTCICHIYIQEYNINYTHIHINTQTYIEGEKEHILCKKKKIDLTLNSDSCTY